MSAGVFHGRGEQVHHRSICLVHLRTTRRPERLETVSRGTVLRGAIRSHGAHSNDRELVQSETGTVFLHSNSFPGFLEKIIVLEKPEKNQSRNSRKLL